MFVLADLIEMSFGCGWSVWLIGFEGVDGEAGYRMNVFALKGPEHGGWHRGEESGMAVENAFGGVGELVDVWWRFVDVPQFVC